MEGDARREKRRPSEDPGILTSRSILFYLITEPFYGFCRHARTGIEEDTAGPPGLLAQAVPMILPLELPQAAKVFHPLRVIELAEDRRDHPFFDIVYLSRL